MCKSWGIWQGAGSLRDPHSGPIPAPSGSVKTQRNTVHRSFYCQSHQIIIVNCMKLSLSIASNYHCHLYEILFKYFCIYIDYIHIICIYWYIKTVQSKWYRDQTREKSSSIKLFQYKCLSDLQCSHLHLRICFLLIKFLCNLQGSAILLHVLGIHHCELRHL